MRNNDKSVHHGHRKRLKKKFADLGGDAFDDHELLELLLFYSIPRSNTNEIAHRLMERFGSINRMAEASSDELKLVDGIGDNSVALLRLVLMLAKRYANEERREVKRLNSIEAIVDYANFHTMGAVKELVYAVYMDENLNVIDTNLIASGTVNEVRPMVRTVLELCILKRSTAVLIFHNHPNGGVEPSRDDILFTKLIERELKMIGSDLVEHIIVDGKDYFAVKNHIKNTNWCQSH